MENRGERNLGNSRKHENAGYGNPLIVSYSYSGNTHRIAQEIQAMLKCDWCEIYPWQPYPMAFTELLEQVRKEIRTGYYPRLLPGSRSPYSCRIILAGSPNWCGSIAPPLASWLYRNDLSGKIILPFCSHCGGVEADFRREIARLCPRADVRETLEGVGDGGEGLREMLRQWLVRTGIWEEAAMGVV